jgi:hypothetical protein
MDGFSRYASFNELAEALFTSEELNRKVADDWNSIHHLGDESFSSYLSQLLPRLNSSQIFGMVSQKHFAQNCLSMLAVAPPEKRCFSDKFRAEEMELSTLALANLRRFLDSEYRLLASLLELGRVPDDKKREILNP